MKRAVALLLIVAVVLLTPGVAQAWRTIDEGRGWGRARAAGRVNSYRYRIVSFYAGHIQEGSSGTFDAAWGVQCRRGFEFSRVNTVHDTPHYYWSPRNVRIPYGQGRCAAAIVVRARYPRNVRMVTGIEVR